MRCKSIPGNESEQRNFSAQSVSTYSETDKKSETQNLGPGYQQQRQNFSQMCMMLELDSPPPQVKDHPWVFSCSAKYSLPSFRYVLRATHTGAGLSVIEPRCPAVEEILSAASVCFLARLRGSLKKTVLEQPLGLPCG